MANIKSAKKRILVNELRLQETRRSDPRLKLQSRRLTLLLLLGTRLLPRLHCWLLPLRLTRLLPREYITRIMLPARYPAYPRLLIPSLNL